MNGWTLPRRVQIGLRGKHPTEFLFRHNALLALCCFAFAVMLWLYVAGSEPVPPSAQIVTRQFTVPLMYTHERVPVIDMEPSQVTVGVQGPLSDVEHPFVRALVDLSKIADPGHYVVPVTVQTIQDPDVSASVVPENVHVFVDNSDVRVLPVTFQGGRDLPAGYRMLTPVIEPNQVTITGPSSLVAAARAEVSVDLSRTTDSLDVLLPVRLTGIPDSNLHLLSIRPAVVRLYLPIQKQVYATVPVSPRWKGALPPGLILKNIVLSPPAVTISSNQEAIETLDHINTVPISLSGLQAGERVRHVPLESPDGVSLKGSGMVTVWIEVRPAPVLVPPPAPRIPPQMVPTVAHVSGPVLAPAAVPGRRVDRRP